MIYKEEKGNLFEVPDKYYLAHCVSTDCALGAGTNRYSMLKDNYVFKFALDHYGFDDDNNTEFNKSMELQPYVTKTYETNGLISVAEYVND